MDDAAEYFLNDTSAIDIDKVQLKERLEEKNHSKIAHVKYNALNSGSTFKQWEKGLEFAKGECCDSQNRH